MKREVSELSLKRPELLDHLWRVQREHGQIRTEDIEACSQALEVSAIEIEGVVSFYHFFTRHPVGRHAIYLNRSIVAETRGYERIKEAFEASTGTTINGVDPSGQFGLFETACIGLSDFEPSALIDFHPFTNLTSLKVKRIVAQLKQGASAASICDVIPDHIRSVPENDRAILLREYDPGVGIRGLRDRSPEAVIEEVEASGLRGMGGAFFPTGTKWRFCRAEPGEQKYIVCNADEGEPGTFKDRLLLSSLSGLLLEGMAIAGYAVGATEGILYLRAEYAWLRERIEQTITHYRKMSLLGQSISGIEGFDFDVRIQLGAGAYVCGEETALLNSLEGQRGEPRDKRFFPTQRGYLQRPTVVNNVETLCAAARVLQLGVERFRASGTLDSPGTKLLSISGDCRLPGIYEIEWGTSVREVLELCEADQPSFIQVSGPSGECISMAEADRLLAHDDLRCGGSFMIFNHSRDLLKVLRNYTNFFKHESCGICTPCRAGNFIIERKLDIFAAHLARRSDIDDLHAWGKIMKATCRCGLGKASPNALMSAQARFPEYFEGLVDQNPDRVSKGFDLEAATREYDRFSS